MTFHPPHELIFWTKTSKITKMSHVFQGECRGGDVKNDILAENVSHDDRLRWFRTNSRTDSAIIIIEHRQVSMYIHASQKAKYL